MEAICIIPARGGSKGVPEKNLQKIGGRSLLEIAVRKAQMAGCFGEIVVSTDCQEIETQARRLGVWVMDQPGASDDSLPDDAERYVLGKMTGFDVVCRLFVTTPFRSLEDVRGPVEMVKNGDASAVVSVTTPTHYPSQNVRMRDDGCYAGHIAQVWKRPRQYWRDLRVINGAVYVASLPHYEQHGYFSSDTKLYEMPQSRSFDIDTLADLEEARRLYDLRFRS
jgi:N-acylneuraminate cytidylyltransferase